MTAQWAVSCGCDHHGDHLGCDATCKAQGGGCGHPLGVQVTAATEAMADELSGRQIDDPPDSVFLEHGVNVRDWARALFWIAAIEQLDGSERVEAVARWTKQADELGWLAPDGGELPSHLRDDAPVLICGRCRRETVDGVDGVGQPCAFPQPDGSHCPGVFERANADVRESGYGTLLRNVEWGRET